MAGQHSLGCRAWWLGHPGREGLAPPDHLPGVFPGFSLSSVEEEGIRRLYVNSVKETGLAFKKGKTLPRALPSHSL